MPEFLNRADLAPFDDVPDDAADALIAAAHALAVSVAPCIDDPSFTGHDTVRAILLGAVLRWNAAGSGAVTTQSAGPFSQTVDTSSAKRFVFYPSEVSALQRLCGRPRRAFAVSMGPK